jgi:outer membrane protein assembly factor BamB
MSATEVAPAPVQRRSFLRHRFPWLVPALAGLALLGLWAWPSEDFVRVQRISSAIMVGMLTVLLEAVWLLFFSGLRWWVRLALPLAVAAAAGFTVRAGHFDGDQVPLPQFRWDLTNDQVLEADRLARAGATLPAPATLVPAGDADFPEYRGRNRDGVAHGPLLARDWEVQPPRQLWRQPVGAGYAAFAVVGPLAVTIEQRRDQEAVVGYDAATGHERWVHSYPAHFTEVLGGEGPRATPTIAGGDVYSLGATGVLVCLDAATGQLKWSADILEVNDNLQWGMSGSPLAYDDVVVVTPGEQRNPPQDRAVVAYDRKTGKKVWGAGRTRGGYSSPMLATLCGKRQVVVFDGEGVGGYDAAGAGRLWFYPWKTERDMNIAQPILLDGDRVFVSKSYNDPGCVQLQISVRDGSFHADLHWKTRNLRTRFTSAVYHQGHLYGLNEGILECVSAKDGQRVWKDGRYGNGQILLVDDNLLILSESGKLALVESTPQGYHELTNFQALKGDKTWNTPALASGKAYVRNHREMACYDLRDERGHWENRSIDPPDVRQPSPPMVKEPRQR